MSKRGYVIGPAPGYVPPPYVVYPQAPQPLGSTVYVPALGPGTRIVVKQTPMVPATYIPPPTPTQTLVYVNRPSPQGQLGVLGSRIGATIGHVVDSALSPPQQTYHIHQYQPVPQPAVQYQHYPPAGPPPNYQEANYPPAGPSSNYQQANYPNQVNK